MEKKYTLPPELEKEIKKLLRPETDDSPVMIELWFGKPIQEDEPLPSPPEDLKHHIKKERRTSREAWFCAVFPASDVHLIHSTYEKISSWPLREVRLNGYRLPFMESLWLPLLFFYLAENHKTH